MPDYVYLIGLVFVILCVGFYPNAQHDEGDEWHDHRPKRKP